MQLLGVLAQVPVPRGVEWMKASGGFTATEALGCSGAYWANDF